MSGKASPPSLWRLGDRIATDVCTAIYIRLRDGARDSMRCCDLLRGGAFGQIPRRSTPRGDTTALRWICNCGAGEQMDSAERSNDFDGSAGEWASRVERESPTRAKSAEHPTIPSIRFTPPRRIELTSHTAVRDD